jgi:hypothetical protein
MACEEPAISAVEDGRLACVPPDAACPRGSTFRAGPAGEHGVCALPPTCPAGTLSETLNERSSCRSIVTTGSRSIARVDVGAWAALVLGVDGGRGSPELCRPLAQRANLFDAREAIAIAVDGTSKNDGGSGDSSGNTTAGGGAASSPSPGVRISVSATFPDEDVSRLHVEVHARTASGRLLEPEGDAVVGGAVTTLFELLRGLGGEASAAAIGLEVTCTLVPPG